MEVERYTGDPEAWDRFDDDMWFGWAYLDGEPIAAVCGFGAGLSG